MDGRTGLCVPNRADNVYDAAWGVGVGAGRYRFSADLDYGFSREVAKAYFDAGLKLDLTYDSDTFRGGRSDEKAIADVAEKYHGLIDIVTNGNEVDGSGNQSSTMPHERCNRIMEISRYYWGDDQLLSAPSLITGDPSWYERFDFTHCNLIDCHWYGIWSPEVMVPSNVPFYGTLDETMDAFVEVAKRRAGRFIPIISTESGLSTNQVSPENQALYVGSTVAYVQKRTDICVSHDVFAFHDHDGYGLMENSGVWKPSLYAYIAAAAGEWSTSWHEQHFGLQGQIQAALSERTVERVVKWQGGLINGGLEGSGIIDQ